jgi:hypothetical protein
VTRVSAERRARLARASRRGSIPLGSHLLPSGGLVIRRVTSAGIRRVHDRYITSPRQVHDRLNQIQSLTGDCGKPLRHNAAARTASRSAGSVAHHGAVPVFHPAAGDAHPVTASVAASKRWRGPIRQPAPAAGANKTSPPSIASRTAENRLPGMHGMHQSGEQSGRPRNGTKRARIGKASGFAHRSFRPDPVRYMSVTTATPCPTAAHDDTWRDKKETARLAAFPQRAGRFRRWWQVLGSNQRRLSRRFYRPLPHVARPLNTWRAAELRQAFARRPRADRPTTVSTL